MRLILKENKPLFFLRSAAVIHFDGDNDRAGIVFVGFLHVRELSVRLEFLHADQGDLHQARELVRTAAVEFLPGVHVALVTRLHGNTVIAVVKCDIQDLCRESRVTAVIRPVCIQHADLRDRGIPVLRICKIILDELEIRKGHCQSEAVIQVLERMIIHSCEAVHDGDIGSLVKYIPKCCGLLHSCLTGVHRIDRIGLDMLELLIGDRSCEDPCLRRPDDRILVFIQQLDALNCGICPLVELSGQSLNTENSCPFRDLDRLAIQNIYRRLGEDAGAGSLKHLIGDVLHVIPDQHAHVLDAGYAEEPSYFFQLSFCCNCIGS